MAAVLRALAAVIDDSGRDVEGIEAELGMPPGHLRRALKGGQALLYEDLLRILDLLEENPARFWDRAFPAPGERRDGG